MSHKLDFNEVLKAIESGQAVTGEDGVLAPLIKQLTKAALEAELDNHLANDTSTNRCNGKSCKSMKSTNGTFELTTPRDHAVTFEPQLVKEHQTSVRAEIETKIMALYGFDMSDADIVGQVEERYGLSVSSATHSAITDKIIGEVKHWQSRPMGSHYSFVWL